ncbi:MAG: FixH family protein [Cyclobacteriaceae bacterium]|nr:FixH family protein [Cyclobacteriaceae bacterium]
MNWGRGIVLAFIGFAIVISTMVVISMKQDVNLVSPDYYKQEIAYQDQIHRQENFNALEEKPVVKKESSNVLLIEFPLKLSTNLVSGDFLFFRPSSSKLDEKFKLDLDNNGTQRISLEKFQKGVWKVRLSWVGKNNMEYYTESVLNL